jgi:membrane-bound lytic murein transglycosylase
MYHLSLIWSNITTYEEIKWDRYHGTGRRAVRFVAQARDRAGLPFQNSVKSVAECLAIAASTTEEFALDADDSEIERLLGERARTLNDNSNHSKLQRAVLVLEKYDPQAKQLYGRDATWRDNFREAFSPLLLRRHDGAMRDDVGEQRRVTTTTTTTTCNNNNMHECGVLSRERQSQRQTRWRRAVFRAGSRATSTVAGAAD